ncbi:alpha/beta hydrolase [Speluncibacter jeojiensis]|uniref:Alpha/beta hydrolase family protein n=1 Tax=Speluncibacter jeojiensis TaxID=2710754 RepID=A0A9X4M1D8_9ACTN|nr:alpha/beta hydrolase family protein [Corynebacteriales bacterium D3-21]
MPAPSFPHLDIRTVLARVPDDPWIIHDQLLVGDAPAIERLGNAFARSAVQMTEADNVFAHARKHFADGYRSGSAGGKTTTSPIDDSPLVTGLAHDLPLSAGALTSTSSDLDAIATALAGAQATAGAALPGLESVLWRIDERLADVADPADRSALTDQAVATVRDEGHRMRTVRDDYAELLDARIANIELRADLRPAPSPTGRVSDAVPGPGSPPRQVRAWWERLDEATRQRLLATQSERLGNLNGIPVAARGLANERVMRADIDRIEVAAATHPSASVDEITVHPGRYGLTDRDITRYTNARQCEQALLRQSDDGANPVHLMTYQPESLGGRGRAAVTLGDPDTAAHTAVVVPGVGSSVRAGYLSRADGLNLYREAAPADPRTSTAVVLWMGYETPDAPSDLRLATPELARRGGALLAADVNGLEATHVGAGAHVTVIGHSYGATTVADAAAADGMRTHDVVLVGCPGTDLARGAGDFHLTGGDVFVGDASSDPVGHIPEAVHGGADAARLLPQLAPLARVSDAGVAGLGSDPAADGYGSVRFKAEVPGGHTLSWRDHSHYFAPGSESLYSMADVVSGNGSLLEEHGMTARHRIGVPLVEVPTPWGGSLRLPFSGGLAVDPEGLRGGVTDGHRHESAPAPAPRV